MTADGSFAAPPVPGARRVAGRAEVSAAWDRLAAAIQPRVAGDNLVLLGILLGGAVTLVQVSARLRGDFQMDACRVSRYAHAVRGGELRWLALPEVAMAGRDVVVLDDIFDEGWTLDFVAAHCRRQGARTVATAVLVHKRHGRPVAPLLPDHVGLELGDEFLIGCGMDYQGRWRHLPEIYGLPGS